MTIKDLLTIYWSQFVLIIIAFGSLIFYFIKRHYDNLSKKIEINHSLFQQNRLNAVNEFYKNYSNAKLLLRQLTIYDIISRKIEPKEIDKIVIPVLNELDKSHLELKIYFEGKEFNYFNNLVKGINIINNKIGELYFDDNQKKEAVIIMNEYYDLMNSVLDMNNKIIEKLSSEIRYIYLK